MQKPAGQLANTGREVLLAGPESIAKSPGKLT